METLWQDVKLGARMLLKRPGFTAVAVLTLALGIGANTAIFSVVDGILLKPLPYPEPEQLDVLYDVQPELPNAPASLPKFLDWQARNRSFDCMAGYFGANFTLTGGSEPERLFGERVTAEFLKVLGVQPILGRGFAKGEDGPGGSRVVLLSYGLWKRRFGSDPNVLGRNLTLNDQSYTVVGVLPAGFAFPTRAELWVPLVPDGWMSGRGSHFLSVIARRKHGVSLEQARAEMKALGDSLNRENGTTHGIRVESYFEEMVGDTRPTLRLLFGAAGFVLLIACANVANLLLARSAARQKEVAVRMALGAGAWRLIRQLLTESLVLALLGGAVGVLVANWGLHGMLSEGTNLLPRAQEIRLNSRVLEFTTALATLAVLFFGALPAWMATRTLPHEALKEGGRGASGSGRQGRLRAALVVSEMALAVVLLAGAGLMLRSFVRVLNEPLGFRSDGLLTLRVALPATRYADETKQREFYRQVLEHVRTLPGVEFAAITDTLPLLGSQTSGGFLVEGRPAWRKGEEPLTELRLASEDYFRAMGIPLRRGRFFTEADEKRAAPVVIINEAMARRFWPGEDPVGKRMNPQWGPDLGWREIVGIVGDVKQTGIERASLDETYVPYRQHPYLFAMYIVARTAGDPQALAAAVRQQVYAVDKDQPVFAVRTMEQLVRESTATRRVSTALISSFAGMALLLAAVGLYGVMAYAVTQRTHEIGIRMALGALPGDVLRLVVRQGMTLALAGVAIGLTAAFGLTRLLSKMLFEVKPTDPATFVIVAVLLAGVALLACYLPARRATRVEPVVALRYE